MKTTLFLFAILFASISCSSDDDAVTDSKPKQKYCDGRKVTIDGFSSSGISITDESTWYPFGEDNTSILYIEAMSEGLCNTGKTSGNKPQFYVCDVCYYLD